MRRRGGLVFDKNGSSRFIICVVTGEMADGTKVWTECTPDRKLIDIGKQYRLSTSGGLSEFIRL